jgi:curli biogenesis system outer membrane secretion channel CsgG
MKSQVFAAWIAIIVGWWPAAIVGAAAQVAGTSKPASSAPTQGTDLTVAILDFDTTAPGNPDLGKQISEALTAELTGDDGFVLVDRSSLARTLQENELNLTGLVNTEKATKIGKLVGARILITGKVFPLDKQLFFTAKIIGTETSLVEGVLVKGDRDGNLGEMLLQLSEKVSKRLHESGSHLVAQEESLADPLPALKKALAGRALPKIAVRIQESHLGIEPDRHFDPAAETEIVMLLKEAGFAVFTGTDREAADAGVKYVVQGKAFSEFAARIATLVNCSARLEVNIVDRKTGEVVYTDRVTTRAIDLAENIAGKTALQKAGRAVGVHILHEFKEILPPVAVPPPAP